MERAVALDHAGGLSHGQVAERTGDVLTRGRDTHTRSGVIAQLCEANVEGCGRLPVVAVRPVLVHCSWQEAPGHPYSISYYGCEGSSAQLPLLPHTRPRMLCSHATPPGRIGWLCASANLSDGIGKTAQKVSDPTVCAV